MANDKENNNFLLTFLAGAAAGAVLGLLYAPNKGSETRKKINDQAKYLSEDIQDFYETAVDTINDLKERIVDIVADVTEGGYAGAAFDYMALKGNWNHIKGKLKQRFSHLSDNDLDYVEGKEDELIGKLQSKLGKTKNQILDLFRSFTSEKSY